MYERDVTYPARRSKLQASGNYKTSSSALITPVSVTFVPEAISPKEAIREDEPIKCKACDESPLEPRLRLCPLYSTRANSSSVICYSTAHTHSHLSSKSPDPPSSPAVLTFQEDSELEHSPASSWTSQDTLLNMSSPLRNIPRVLSRSLRTQASIAPRVSIGYNSFSSSTSKRNADTAIPKAPKEEDAALKSGKPGPTFLGTSKRLPEFNLGGKVVLVTGAGRGLGFVQAEALLEAGATGNLEIPPSLSSLTN